MARQLVAPLFAIAAIGGCAKATDRPIKPKALDAIVAPCIAAFRPIPGLIEVAAAGAQDPSYAAQAKELAVACKTARTELEERDGASPCLPIIQSFEVLGWQLNSGFDGRQPMPSIEVLAIQFSGLDSRMGACATAMGRTPFPDNPEVLKAEKQADDAAAAAETARMKAEAAAAGANRRIDKSTSTVREDQ